MSSSLNGQSTLQTRCVQIELPCELWFDITAQILGDYIYHLIVNDDNQFVHRSHAAVPELTTDNDWDAIGALLHTCRIVRACALGHLTLLFGDIPTSSSPPSFSSKGECRGEGERKVELTKYYKSLVTYLHLLRDRHKIESIILNEWDYAPGARFFETSDPPPSINSIILLPGPVMGREGELPLAVVLARLHHTLAASEAFAQEGWDWFPYDALEVYGLACTALLLETYRAVPAYARHALVGRIVERIAKLQVSRIKCEFLTQIICTYIVYLLKYLF
ncbi:hypothetical protein B0F90DRAFT_634252 [Multifurca ochricompacta]|uniref:Uncharacterized protein n=1 Tax=Multifurca ochricompacta TaxID=376703 RepID=A0AAD4M2Y7_9AGAM|nr:hypothetical protein B0F90DRAFT_634252 [Multifurca ochricompacta]